MPALVKKKKNSALEKKIAIVNLDKCKPNSNAYNHLKRVSRLCAKDCIFVKGKIVKISESACTMCFHNAKRTPEGAVIVTKCPTESNPSINVVHSYGENAFRLYELPEPTPGAVLGLLGTNGIGKTTAIKILSGFAKPNFGVTDESKQPSWKDVIKYYRGSALQNYFIKLSEKKLKVAIKPQLTANFSLKFKNKSVGSVLKKVNQRGESYLNSVIEDLEIIHLLDNEIGTLSGGELQRFAIALTVIKDADVYFFDEPSSFLDCKQRLIATDIIRSLLDPNRWPKIDKIKVHSKYIIAIEHDLTILDYISDYVQCLYGKPSVYGVVTKKSSINIGINEFLSGNIKNVNMRFRSYSLNFKNNSDNASDETSVSPKNSGTNKTERNTKLEDKYKYPAMKKWFMMDDRVKGFELKIERGGFREKEVICLLGQNGCGKSTFMELLSGNSSNNEPKIKSKLSNEEFVESKLSNIRKLGISYKKQNNSKFFRKFKNNTVQELLESKINGSLSDSNFSLMVINPLNIDALKDRTVGSLSGGEKQRLAIAICLGTPASIYLIDEPSADLDYEQRIITAKIIKKWIVNYLGKTCFLIEHDFLMSSAIADRVIVYEGIPGISCTAKAPISMEGGFNSFLKQLGITFRRDRKYYRPRINKKGSARDREQKKANNYYIFQ